jgi:hypothetical protein
MAIDSTLPVRRAILTHIGSVAAVTAIVPKSRHYPMVVPANVTWPFVRYGSPTPVPLRASCLDGTEIVVAVHGFAKARMNASGAMIETAEDHAGRLGAALAAALDGIRLDLPRGHAKVRWTGSQLLVDGAEADAFHCVVNLGVRCITA